MYIKSKELDFNILYQGDVIKNFPFCVFSGWDDAITKSYVEGKTLLTNVAILSQTCDVQERESVIIAPIFPISKMGLGKSKIEALEKRKTGYWFYLPKIEEVDEATLECRILLEESILDFQMMYYVPRTFLEKFKNNKFASMNDWGRHHLGWALSKYFGRPIENKYV